MKTGTDLTILIALAVSVLVCACQPAGDAEAPGKPNIIVIMLDDMGYSDIGCFGGEIQTPNLDRMAAEGVRFNEFYNTARCCPSRATIMTGLYPHQAGVGHMDTDWGLPGYRGHLSKDCVTIAEALQPAGYRTIMSGKWHLGTGEGQNPWERGFECFYGIPKGGGVYFWPTTLDRAIVRYQQDTGPVITKPDDNFYTTDAFSDYAVEQIRLAQQDDQPFFIYLAYVTPHWPHQAWERDIRKYIGKYKQGWEELRQARYRRQVEMGIVDPKFKISEGVELDWNSLTETQKIDLDRQMAVYAAQIDNLDQNVGKILDALRQTGTDQDTLTIFLSDNGAQGQHNGPLGYEQDPEKLFGTRESLGKVAEGWGNLSNTPFRRYKYETHEGGTATPLILHWPRGIEARGKIRQQPGHIIDIVPTCLDAAGLDPAVARRGDHTSQMEGISLLPFAREDLPEKSRTLCWNSGGNRAVRAGDWKLVAPQGKPWELYNLSEDRTELHDLAGEQPERVAELVKIYEAWAERCNVLPWPVKRNR